MEGISGGVTRRGVCGVQFEVVEVSKVNQWGDVYDEGSTRSLVQVVDLINYGLLEC